MVDLPTEYTAARQRIAELVRDLDDAALSTPVASCPGWAVRDVVAHLAGVACDVAGARFEGGGSDAWTAAQVDARQRSSIADLLDEWQRESPAVVAAIEAGSVPFAFDVVTHEQDIRGALERPGARDVAADVLLQPALAALTRKLEGAGLPALRFETGADTYTTGGGEPAVTVKVDRYEMVRAASGRRSEAQIRALDWSGDAAPYVALFSFLPMATGDVIDN